MELDQLNEELLIWAGFVKADIKKAYYWVRCDRKAKWIAPGHQRPDKPLYFPDDIKACFDWLVPKLWTCEMRLLEGGLFTWLVGCLGYGPNVDGLGHNNPATALCLAVKKMLDNKLSLS